MDRYPEIEPYEHGLLDVGDGNQIYWEACGNPDGKPALNVHGGPGSGCSALARRKFDPERYRAILFDQRGCGRSTPHASDPATDLSVNTTAHLVRDMELLREHLGIDKWLLWGASWGGTLTLAYAEQFPERVSEIVLASMSMTRRSDIDWLYRGVARFFPAEWEQFRDHVTEAAHDGDLLAAYARLMANPDPAVREAAADAWIDWENAVISLESNGKPGQYGEKTDLGRLAFVRICAHYFSQGAFLDEGVLLRDAGKLADIPGVIVHGRHDLGGPVATAWDLANAWPGAELHIIEDSGHTGSETMRITIRTALDTFARS